MPLQPITQTRSFRLKMMEYLLQNQNVLSFLMFEDEQSQFQEEFQQLTESDWKKLIGD